ncbi:MAG: filamentation induced by cAMP protein [Planctomycetota bacterium]|nr:MAG: filamentation induced by cAMP protein [Planctomycetota bacterium]
MIRGRTGRPSVSGSGDEPVRAFIPFPLPPEPAINLSGPRQLLLEQALLSLGRLDSISSLLPDTELFLYAYVRKEAVLSSQIEGTQSSLSDLLLFELKEAPGVPVVDAVEVSNYVAALSHGLKRLRGGFPLSTRLLREIHGVLLRHGRGGDKAPGDFRRSQNWIGGTRPGNAHFVPPPPDEVAECMSRLEHFLHEASTPLPILVRAALAHVQFETIHPFLDGNGRVGRLLITFLLCHAGILREPLLYLSLYFKQRRKEYYRLLDVVREKGDWEEWLDFFLEGVRVTADGAVTAAKRLVEMFQADQARIQARGRAAGSALRVHAELQASPITTQAQLARKTGLSFPAAGAGLKILVGLKIAREITGQKRNRVFAYDRYLSVLSEGTEPLRT